MHRFNLNSYIVDVINKGEIIFKCYRKITNITYLNNIILPFYMLGQFFSSHIQMIGPVQSLRSCDHYAVGSLYEQGHPEHHRLNP